jgi:hypothetical protein
MGTILRRYEATPLGARLLEMGNVGHVVASRPEAFGLSAVASFPSVFGPPVRSFRVPGALPPAYVVEGIHVAAEPHSFEVMAAPAFDPRREAIVAGGLAEQVPTGAFDAAAQLLSRRPHRVVVDARLSAPGLLVLVEAWARGWSVEVDGKPAPLLRANVLFQGVALPGGRHSVTFSYSPPLLAAGASASLVAVLLGALAAIRPRRGTSGVEGRDPER